MPSHDDLNSVIVADDSGQCRNTLRTALMECGFLVLLVWDGLEALETASSTSVRAGTARREDAPHGWAPGLCSHQGPTRLRVRANCHAERLCKCGDARCRGAGRCELVPGQANLESCPQAGDTSTTGCNVAQPAVSFEWKRQPEPSPAYGEAKELAQGRRVLEIYRRANVSTKPSTRTRLVPPR